MAEDVFSGTREALCFDGQLPTTRLGTAGKVDLGYCHRAFKKASKYFTEYSILKSLNSIRRIRIDPLFVFRVANSKLDILG